MVCLYKIKALNTLVKLAQVGFHVFYSDVSDLTKYVTIQKKDVYKLLQLLLCEAAETHILKFHDQMIVKYSTHRPSFVRIRS